MSDDDKRKIVDSAKQAFPELQSVPNDQIQFSPPEDSSNSDTLHLLGNLPGRVSVWVRRSKLNTVLAVYLVCQTAYSHWTFIRDMYRFVRPTIAQIPVVVTQVSHWLRCYETLNPASSETGRRLVFSPGWHAARDEDQLVAMINQQIGPEFGVFSPTATTSTTTTTPAPQSSSGPIQPIHQDLLFIPEGTGIVSTDVIGGAPPLVPVRFRGYNNSQFVSRENATRIRIINDGIRQRNMSQNYRRPIG
jgi:hypothetical protein